MLILLIKRWKSEDLCSYRTFVLLKQDGQLKISEKGSSLVVQWVKDSVLLHLQLGFHPWPGNFHMPWVQQKKKKKKKKKREKTKQREEIRKRSAGDMLWEELNRVMWWSDWMAALGWQVCSKEVKFNLEYMKEGILGVIWGKWGPCKTRNSLQVLRQEYTWCVEITKRRFNYTFMLLFKR